MLHERLELLRNKRNLSQKEVAQRLGIARTTYSGYENGTREPDLKMLNKITDLYDVKLEWLVNGEERKVSSELEELIEDYIKLNEEDQNHIKTLIERLKKERH